MGVVRNLMVRAGADFSAITKQANKAKNSMKGMQTSISKSCSGMTAAVSGLNKVLGIMGASLSVAAVVSFGKSAKAAYDEQTEASAKLAQAMKNTMGARADEIKSIEALIDAQELLGVVDGAVQTEAAQELSTYLTLSSSLKTLIPVMNDMVAQQYGIAASAGSAVSIATMMGKVMNGQTSALSRYGYSFTEAQEAILKYGTEAQRAAVLAEVVSQSVGGMNAALAATPNGRMRQLSFTLGKIQETFGQAINSIGVLFIPGLQRACSVLASLATLANKVAQTLANVFGSGAASAAEAISYTGAVSGSIGELEAAAESTSEAMGILGFDKITKLPSSSVSSGENTSGNISAGIISESSTDVDAANESIGWLEQRLTTLQEKLSDIDTSKLTRALAQLKEAVSPFTEDLFSGLSWAMDNIFVPMTTWVVEDGLPGFLDTLSTSTGNLSPVLEGLKTALQPLAEDAFAGLRWAYDNVFIPFASWTGGKLLPEFLGVLSSACNVLNIALEILSPLGTWLWDNFLVPVASWTGGTIVNILGSLADALDRVGEWISTHQTAVKNIAIAVGTFAAVWTACNAAVTLWNTIGTVASAVTTAFGVAVNVLTSPITLVIAAIAALVAIVVLLVKNWDWVKETAAKVWEGIKNVWSGVSEWFQTKVIDPIVNSFKNFANGVIGFFEGLVNSGINGINKLIGAINKISFDVPEWVPVIGGKTFGFNIPTVKTVSLPRLATGHVVEPNDEFTAVLGDNKTEREIVSPVSLMQQAFRDVIKELGTLSGSNPTKVVIPVYVGGRKVSEKVIEDINDITRTTGECPIRV